MTPSISDSELKTTEITECVISGCAKPLGQESRDLGYPVCHEHRKCAKCGRDCQVVEVEACWRFEAAANGEKEYVLKPHAVRHARCRVLEHKALSDDIELMNLARLLLWPDPSLSRTTLQHTTTCQFNSLVPLLNHDQLLLMIDQMEAVAAAGRLALGKNKRVVEEQINEREKHKAEKAIKERTESLRTPADKKAMSGLEKQLKTFTDMGMPLEAAKEMVNQLKASRKDMLR